MSMLIDEDRISNLSGLYVSDSYSNHRTNEPVLLTFTEHFLPQSVQKKLEVALTKMKMIGDVIRSNQGVQSSVETDREIYKILDMKL